MATHVRNVYWWANKKQFKENSVVLITGAASGIGKNVALIYARRRVRLILVDFDKVNLGVVVAECQQLGSQAIGCHTDCSKQDQVKQMMARGIKEYGELDIMVLCAGIAAHHLFETTHDLSIFDKLMAVNFFGYLYCVKEAYPHLVQSNGSLVAITSFSGEVGLPYRTAYCASKFAVTGFLEALRAETDMLRKQHKKSFSITIVCPPTVNTNLRANSLTTDKALRDAGQEQKDTTMSVEQCATAIVDAADRKLRKAFFPFKSFLASYLRPLVPDLIDEKIRKRASL
jgi:short-subunit dehydrogenase